MEDSAEQPTVNAAVADAVSSMLPSMSDTIQSETLPGWYSVDVNVFIMV